MAGREQPQRAVVRAQEGQRADDAGGAQRALVAVTREIDNRLAIIGASSAAGIEPDRLKMVALGAFTRTPALWTCDPVSIARSIVEAGQLGLEPTGLLGGAYLVPRRGQCTLLVGYRGLVMLAKRSGEVSRVEARVVREHDTFDYGYGLEPYLDHHPSRDADPGNYTAAYAVIVFRDAGRQFDVMSYAEIEAIRKRSASPGDGPWVTDWPEMAKKTALRRLLKLAPLTIQVAAQLDEIDPEVRPGPSAAPDTRQSELRAQLQAALDREYGPGQDQPAAQPPVVVAPAPQPTPPPAAEAEWDDGL
jgi:recombination protein RecT